MKDNFERNKPYDRIIEALQQIQINNNDDFNEVYIRIDQLEDKNRKLADSLENIVNIFKN